MMRRGVNGGEMGWNSFHNHNTNNNNALDTINAAATAIASAEARVSPPNSQKKRWGSCLSIYWCFGSHKHDKRYSHAVLVPEPTESRNYASAVNSSNYSTQPPPIAAPFVAPPSSPASFLPSEPPSATQSPAGVVSVSHMSNNIYSPGGPRNIFAVGPYAYETQLVSPPVFSTFTTEPSTAPFTPPPESVHLTTPPSPEVPFAHLLNPGHGNGDVYHRFPLSHYEFPTYQIYPDNLVSPGSVMSNSSTSSPFPDREVYAGGVLQYSDIRHGFPPKFSNFELLRPPREWGSQQGSGSLTPDAAWPRSGIWTPDATWPKSGTITPDAMQPMSGSLTPNPMRREFRDRTLLVRQDSTVSPLPNLTKGHTNNEALLDHRVSFELTAEDVIRCVEREPTSLPKALRNTNMEHEDEDPANMSDISGNFCERSRDVTEKSPAEVEEEQRCQKQRSVSLGSIKEFNFDNAKRADSKKSCIGSNWWANERVLEKDDENCNKNWSFFPMMQQPGVS